MPRSVFSRISLAAIGLTLLLIAKAVLADGPHFAVNVDRLKIPASIRITLAPDLKIQLGGGPNLKVEYEKNGRDLSFEIRAGTEIMLPDGKGIPAYRLRQGKNAVFDKRTLISPVTLPGSGIVVRRFNGYNLLPIQLAGALAHLSDRIHDRDAPFLFSADLPGEIKLFFTEDGQWARIEQPGSEPVTITGCKDVLFGSTEGAARSVTVEKATDLGSGRKATYSAPEEYFTAHVVTAFGPTDPAQQSLAKRVLRSVYQKYYGRMKAEHPENGAAYWDQMMEAKLALDQPRSMTATFKMNQTNPEDPKLSALESDIDQGPVANLELFYTDENHPYTPDEIFLGRRFPRKRTRVAKYPWFDHKQASIDLPIKQRNRLTGEVVWRRPDAGVMGEIAQMGTYFKEPWLRQDVMADIWGAAEKHHFFGNYAFGKRRKLPPGLEKQAVARGVPSYPEDGTYYSQIGEYWIRTSFNPAQSKSDAKKLEHFRDLGFEAVNLDPSPKGKEQMRQLRELGLKVVDMSAKPTRKIPKAELKRLSAIRAEAGTGEAGVDYLYMRMTRDTLYHHTIWTYFTNRAGFSHFINNMYKHQFATQVNRELSMAARMTEAAGGMACPLEGTRELVQQADGED